MNFIAVCSGCGRTIDGKFVYCPWCGISRVSKREEPLDLLFNHYEENKKMERRKQLANMERQLEKLEEELSVLVLSAEMHK
ncbi:MAG: zinc ribbon domain-containing protein [Treponema sp.]|nr:zinc ribbon domain-containing protein [Treponema sp.]